MIAILVLVSTQANAQRPAGGYVAMPGNCGGDSANNSADGWPRDIGFHTPSQCTAACEATTGCTTFQLQALPDGSFDCDLYGLSGAVTDGAQGLECFTKAPASEYRTSGAGLCQGHGVNNSGWPRAAGRTTADQCEAACNQADGCRAYDLANPGSSGQDFDCTLFNWGANATGNQSPPGTCHTRALAYVPLTGSCRGTGWNAGGWPKVEGPQSLGSALDKCLQDPQCSAFQLSQLQNPAASFNTSLFGHGSVVSEGLQNMCFVVASREPVPGVAGIMGFYPLDINADDHSPNNATGYASDAVYYDSCQFGRCAVFTQPDAYIGVPGNAASSITSYSLSGWFNPAALSPLGAETADWGTLVGRLKIVRGSGRVRLDFWYDGNRRQGFESRGVLPVGRWTFVAVTYDDASKTVSFYLNGALDSAQSTASLGNIHALPPFWRVNIGGEDASHNAGMGWGDTIFNGMIHGVMLHARALSAAEIGFLAGSSSTNRVRRNPTCGGYMQPACSECTSHWWWPPLAWDSCQETTPACDGNLRYTEEQGCVCPPGMVHAGTGPDCIPPRVPPPQPKIEVSALEKPLIFPKPDGNQFYLTGVTGYRAVVTNADLATYFVPDSSQTRVSCRRLQAYKGQVCKGGGSSALCNPDLKNAVGICSSQPLTCSNLSSALKFNPNPNRRFALRTLEEWDGIYPGGLKVNANWFDIRSDDITNYPHVSPCTDIFGYSVTPGENVAEGHILPRVVSRADNPDPFKVRVSDPEELNYLDALVVTTEDSRDRSFHYRVQIVANADIAKLQGVTAAVGGFILIKDGQEVSKYSSSTKPDQSGARTGFGVSADGKTLFFVVVEGGMNAQQLGFYIKSLGAKDVINLDNSGSSQLYYKVDGKPPVKSKTSELDENNRPAYRPVPNFFQVTVQ